MSDFHYQNMPGVSTWQSQAGFPHPREMNNDLGDVQGGQVERDISQVHAPLPGTQLPTAQAESTQLNRAPSNPARLNAIAQLKRAASNRQMRAVTPQIELLGVSPGPQAASEQPDFMVQIHPTSPNPAPLNAQDAAESESSHGHRRLDRSPIRIVQPSPSPSALDSGAVSPANPLALSRSASTSRAEGNRSPLPSLEQLRSRILHERLTAGLQRSASASAASAAARAYAMDKLLGQDTSRHRATSPVSDSGGRISEEDEEDAEEDGETGLSELGGAGPSTVSQASPGRGAPPAHYDSEDEEFETSKRKSRRRGMGNQYLRPPSFRNSVAGKHLLRRSRTISGMSQRAEDERKAAFAQELEWGSPDGSKKKRMSRLPPRRSPGGPGQPEEESPPGLPPQPAFLSQSLLGQDRDGSSATAGHYPRSASPLQHSDDGDQEHPTGRDGPQGNLSRKPSRRELARTEMMRKLSGRRLGGRSPVPPPRAASPQDAYQHPDQQGDTSLLQSEDGGAMLPGNEDGTHTADTQLAHGGGEDLDVPGGAEDDEEDFDEDEAEELLASPTAPFRIPIETLDPQDAHIGMQPPQFQGFQPMADPSTMANLQLTPEQQIAFFQMQQLLQQQQAHLFASQAQMSQAVEAPDMSPANSQLPETPVMTSNADPSPDHLLTPATSFSGAGRGATWDSPGGQSLLGNNLIPSMHLAPFVSDSGQQQGLTSDVYAQGLRSNFAKGQDAQDWPTSPTASSLGLNDALSRSRLNSMDRYSLERREEAVEDDSRERDERSGRDQSPPKEEADAADSEPPSTASTDVDLSAYLAEGPGASASQKGNTGGAARRDFLGPPKLVAAFESPDRPGTTYSQATSMGDGDHFVYESMLAGAASASTLGHFPSSFPSPKFGQVNAASPRMMPGSSLAGGATYSPASQQPLISPRGASQARDQASAAIAAARARAAGSPTAVRHGQQALQLPAQEQVSPASSPAAELDDMERFAAWQKWMKAQGMDVEGEGEGDEESTTQGFPVLGSSNGGTSVRSPAVSRPAQNASIPAPLRLPPLSPVPGTLAVRPGSDRVEDDFSISPTLLKEFGSDIEWPGRPSLRQSESSGANRRDDASASDDTPTRTKGLRSLDDANNTDFDSPGPSVPPKPRLQPQRTASTRRKAPPTLNALEVKALQETPSTKSPRIDRDGLSPSALGHSSVAESDQAQSPRPYWARADEASSTSRHDTTGGLDAHGQSALGLTGSTSSLGQPQSDLGHAQRSNPLSEASPRLTSRSEQHHGGASTQMSGRSFSETRQQAGGHGTSEAPTQKTPPSAWSGSNVTPRYGYRSRHHRVPSASEFETENAYANGKLTPFPGLLRNQPSNISNTTRRSQSPAVKLASQSPVMDARSSPSVSSPPLDISALAGKDSNAQQDGSTPKVGLFGSLRRKASAVVRKGSMRRKVGESPDAKAQGSPSSSPRVGDRQLPFGTSEQEAMPRAHEAEQYTSSQSQRTPVTPVSAATRQTPRLQTFDRYANTGAALTRKPSRVTASDATDTAVQPQENVIQAQRPVQPAPDQPTARGPAAHIAHSRNVSDVSAASSQQQHPVSSSPSRTNARQALPGGEDSLDSGLAAPAPRETAPIATTQLEPKTAAMLHRYSRVLTTTTKANATSPGVPPGLTSLDLDSPPRQLLKVSPVFQVVSSSMIKDRFLILFNDILVIAKPVAPPPSQALPRRDRSSDEVAEVSLPDIRWTFLVKNIIELRHLSLTVPKDHRSKIKPHPLQGIFVEAFSHDADGAVSDLIKRTGLPNTAATTAQLLIQTLQLDRDVLTAYICAPERRDILTAFVKLQRVVGVSIESALRTILIGLRFPTDSVAFEVLLMTLSAHWVEENRHLIKSNFTSQLAADLTFAIMALNDALHGKGGSIDDDEDDFSEMSVRGSVASVSLNSYHPPGIFSEPMRTLSNTAFVSAFRAQDPDMILSDRTLFRIYASVKAEPIQQALGRGEVAHKKPVWIVGDGLPLKLTYGVPSEPVLVSIPTPDPDFSIRLYGHDLTFEPPILSFASANTRSFTITSRSLGTRQAVFVRSGRAARCYSGSVMGKDVSPAMQAAASRGSIADLPASVSLSVERAFMQHSFTLNASLSPASAGQGASGGVGAHRRKFMFSVDNSDLRRNWALTLQSAIDESLSRRAETQAQISGKQGSEVAEAAIARRAANALALHVLRQALISPDTPAKPSTTDSGHKASSMLQRSVSAAAGGPSGRSEVSGQPAGTLNKELSGSASIAARNVGQLHSRTPSDSGLAFGEKAGVKVGQERGLLASRRGPSTLAVNPAQANLARNASVSQHYYAPRSGAGREERELLPSSPLPESTSSKPSGVNPSSGVPPQDPANVAQGSRDGVVNPTLRQQQPQSGRTQARQGGSSAGETSGDNILSGEELVTICTQNSLLPIVLERGGGNAAAGSSVA